jgi:hypothetical protein
MRRTLIAVALLLSATMFACTEQGRARSWGGKANLDVPAGRKLVMVTWKNDDLWLLTRAMKPTEQPETYDFQESSSWGTLQGKVTIREADGVTDPVTAPALQQLETPAKQDELAKKQLTWCLAHAYGDGLKRCRELGILK